MIEKVDNEINKMQPVYIRLFKIILCLKIGIEVCSIFKSKILKLKKQKQLVFLLIFEKP